MLRPFFHAQTIFGLAVLRGRRKGFCTLPKMCKTWGFCNRFKNVGRRRGIWGRFAKMHVTFSWQAQYFRQVEWKNRKTHWVHGRQLCTQLSIFEGSLAELLRFWCCMMLWTSKIEEVSQIGSVFGCSQLRKLRTFRRIASFSILHIDR